MTGWHSIAPTGSGGAMPPTVSATASNLLPAPGVYQPLESAYRPPLYQQTAAAAWGWDQGIHREVHPWRRASNPGQQARTAAVHASNARACSHTVRMHAMRRI